MAEKSYVTARFTAKKGKVDDLIQVLKELTVATQNESGCLDYGYYQSTENSHIFTSFEIWADLESETAHWQTQHLKKALDKLPELVEGEPEITKYAKVA